MATLKELYLIHQAHLSVVLIPLAFNNTILDQHHTWLEMQRSNFHSKDHQAAMNKHTVYSSIHFVCITNHCNLYAI